MTETLTQQVGLPAMVGLFGLIPVSSRVRSGAAGHLPPSSRAVRFNLQPSKAMAALLYCLQERKGRPLPTLLGGNQ
jgi:hypothetical protein